MNQLIAERPSVDAMQGPAGGDLIIDQQPSLGLRDFNSLSNRALRSRPGIALTSFVTALGIGGSAELMAPTFASAQENPTATASSVFHWDNVGGNPLVPRGIHSASQAEAFVESPKGHTALKREGLNRKEIQAVEQAVKTEGMRSCNVTGGDVMVSGGNETDYNVVEGDPDFPNGVPGFCVNAVRKFTKGNRKFTETIKEAIAGPCGNALEVSKRIVSKVVHRPKPKKVAPVKVKKIAEDDQGHLLPATPTGTFRFEVKCRGKSGPIDRTVIYNHTPQSLARCLIGSKVKVSELEPLGPDHWKLLTPGTQAMRVGKSNIFVFKDQELPPQGPPPPPSVPPKNGTEGPGAGTPGQPGGPGAGGSPGNSNEGAPCYDDASTVNGDQSTATSGGIMYGTPDQFGYCVGPATQMQNP